MKLSTWDTIATASTATEVEHFSTVLRRITSLCVHVYVEELQISHSQRGQATVVSSYKMPRKWMERKQCRLLCVKPFIQTHKKAFEMIKTRLNKGNNNHLKFSFWPVFIAWNTSWQEQCYLSLNSALPSWENPFSLHWKDFLYTENWVS